VNEKKINGMDKIRYRSSNLAREVNQGRKDKLWNLAKERGAFRVWLSHPKAQIRVVIAESADRIVGWAAKLGPLMGWFVDPEFRNQGIATELTKRILNKQPPTVWIQAGQPFLINMVIPCGYVLIDPGSVDKETGLCVNYAKLKRKE
jgi:hypothetical protein